jgi:hypothetical protein
MLQENFATENVLNFSPIMCAVRQLFGNTSLESFEIEYFEEDLDRAILNQKIKVFKSLTDKFLRAPMGDVSYFVYMDEEVYTWKHLQ